MIRRAPVSTLVGHLAWTRSGTVWATWRIRPVPYGFRPVAQKRAVRDFHRALWRAQQGEALVLGLCASLDPVSVVERMISGVDLDACPEWAAECEATLDTLAGIPLGERALWLSVPLANYGWGRLAGPAKASVDVVRDLAALPRARPPEAVVQARLQQARMIADAVPAVFAPTPVSVAEQVWIAGHMQRRGMVDLPTPDDPVTAQILAPRSGLALPEPVLDEGGQTDVARSVRRRLNPLDRRYLKVLDPRQVDQPASYQCLLAVADVPAGGMTFPGSEYLGRLDECGVDVDYALRLRVNSRAKVLKRNRRAVNELNDQYEQREGQLTTGQHELDYAAQLLTQYQSIFANDELEVEVEHTTILAVADTDPEAAQACAATVSRYLRNIEFKLDRPIGGMEELWWAMHIGVPTSRLVRQYAQFTTATDFAAAVPFITTRLGDRRGPIVALNTSTARLDVVHHDLAGHPAMDISASFSFAGELGSGKALDVDTPLPTPGGWIRMGDVRAGDRVFDEHGQPTRVVAVSDVMTSRWCFGVEFCDGSSLVADAGHLWAVLPAAVCVDRRVDAAAAPGGAGSRWLAPSGGVGTAEVMTTWQLAAAAARHGPGRYVIPTCGPLRLSDQPGLTDPFILGARLGAAATAGPRIPAAHLRGSDSQRRALLAGLLSTAATSSARVGETRLAVAGVGLAVDVEELACSLGYRCDHGQSGHLPFGAGAGTATEVVTIAAPPGRHLPGPAGRSGEPRHACSGRCLTAFRAVQSRPVRCIEVASGSGLYLAGRSFIPTHNSFGLKSLAGPVVDRGGQLLAVDRTTEGEWAAFAEALPSRTVVDVLEPRHSMDPLRVFGPVVGSRIAQAFMTVACDIVPQSEFGDAAAEVLDPGYLAEHRVTSLGGLVRHLAEDCRLDGAAGLARRLRRFANMDLGRVVFDPDLPPVSLDSAAIVWRTNSLELPSRDELTSEHLFRQLRLEKVLGRAYYTLITSAARAAAFADRARFALFVCDEAYYITSSPEGERDVAQFVREGRRANAAVGLGSHDPEEDFGSQTLRGLMPVRFLMRHRSEVLAHRGLTWLGIDPDDPSFPVLLKQLREDTSPVLPDGGVAPERRGEGFLRDAYGAVGSIKILGPAREVRFTAALTSPTRPAPG